MKSVKKQKSKNNLKGNRYVSLGEMSFTHLTHTGGSSNFHFVCPSALPFPSHLEKYMKTVQQNFIF